MPHAEVPGSNSSSNVVVASTHCRTVVLKNQTPAQLVLRYLALEGVSTIFGIPGAAVMQILDELRIEADRFEFVVCRHETGAAFMADGFARVSGGLGVVLVTSGPGATNALTGSMNADNSGTPLLTLSGEVKQQYFGMGYLQEGIDADLDVDAIYQAANTYSVVIDDPENFCTLFQQALREARSVPRRATHVSLPMNVAGTPMASVTFPSAAAHYRVVPQAGQPDRVEEVLTALLAATRPLIFVGNGCRAALRGELRDAVCRFVERHQIPVMTTPEAKGLFPEGHPLSLRNYGLAGCAWPSSYLKPPPGAPPFDALLVLGSSLGEIATSPTVPTQVWDSQLLPTGPFMQVDLDQAAIGRVFPIDIGIVADVAPTLEQLCRSGAAHPIPASAADRRRWIDEIKATVPPAPAPPGPGPGPVHPAQLLLAVSRALPAGTHLFFDCGNCVGWSLAYLEINPPTELHAALAMGPMGFAVGAVIGAKMAAPHVPCVAVTGDGAFLMHGSEVSTASRYGVGAVWIVLCDDDLAMVSQGMNEFFPQRDWNHYYSLGAPDVAAYARALGATTWTVPTYADLAPALSEAFGSTTSQPKVIAVEIDRAPVPPYYLSASLPTHPL